jgi:hypothetical protein
VYFLNTHGIVSKEDTRIIKHLAFLHLRTLKSPGCRTYVSGFKLSIKWDMDLVLRELVMPCVAQHTVYFYCVLPKKMKSLSRLILLSGDTDTFSVSGTVCIMGNKRQRTNSSRAFISGRMGVKEADK